MATIRDLKPSFTQISAELRFDLVKLTRESRRIVKKTKKASTRKPRKQVSPIAAAKSLTKEQKLALLRELQGKT